MNNYQTTEQQQQKYHINILSVMQLAKNKI